MKLNKKEIAELLPHREPMLLIDELINIKKLYSATAIMNVKKNAFYVEGHFPDNPVMPGVLIVEAFGQAAAALTAHGIDKKIAFKPEESSKLELKDLSLIEELKAYLEYIKVDDTNAVITEFQELNIQ